MDFVDLAFELLSILNAADVQIDVRVVQVCRRDVPRRDFVTIDEKLRLVFSPANDSRHVLPLVLANDSRSRRYRAVGLIGRVDRFDSQNSLIVGHVEVPAVSPTVFAQAEDASLSKFVRTNPGRDGEFSLAHVHRLVARNHDRVAVSVERNRLAKRRVHKLRVTIQTARQFFSF